MFQKTSFVAVTSIIVVTFCFAGLQLGEIIGWSEIACKVLSAVGTAVGFLSLFLMYRFGVDSVPSKSTYVIADDLEPGIYHGLGSGCHNGNYYHIVLPVTDGKSEWSVEPILVVRRSDTNIPDGKFEVTEARKVIQPLKG